MPAGPDPRDLALLELAAENADLRARLAEAQDQCVEMAVDAGELQSEIDMLRGELASRPTGTDLPIPMPYLLWINTGGTLLHNRFGCIASTIAGLSLCLPLTTAVQAQAPAPVAKPATATPDAATLKVAREVVAQMQGDRTNTLNSMAAPMAGMMQQIGIKEPERAQVIVREVVLPMMTAHYDELLDIQARSFASVLGKEDLQAVGTFYASPAGKRLAAAQPQLAQAQMTGMTQWMGGLMPEMQAKITQAIKAHGWGPSDKPK